jgi:signal peptidase
MSTTTIALLAVVLAVFGVATFLVGSGRWQARPILSGSMRPGFAVGSVALTEREPLSSLRLDAVIVTHPPGEPHVDLVHRVIQIKSMTSRGAVVQTKGDANSAADPFTVRVNGPWIYQVKTTIPLVGYAALAVHSPAGRRLLLGLAALLLVIAWLRILGQQRRKNTKHRAAVAPTLLESPPHGSN